MRAISRRDLLKTSMLAPAAVAAQQFSSAGTAVQAAAREADGALPVSMNSVADAAGAIRERLLLDFGWRFHFGHADNIEKDFGYGAAWSGNYQKTGNFLRAGSLAFDDAEWKPVDLPHDWAIELPFTNDPALRGKGYYPLGRNYPENSVGWYRRIFTLDDADKGKRIVLEFDGAYRESMVIFNNYYIGTHSGGYDPFSFDVTEFANPGGDNVLLVRVDATSTDGWFYEGAGIYRHVWLVKTHPVHVKQWGTFVRAEIKNGAAALLVGTEIENAAIESAEARVVSTILDPAGKEVGRNVTAAAAIAALGGHAFEQKISVANPQLWSLEERNLYTLLTEVRVGGEVADSTRTRFGIRSIEVVAGKGLLLNGKPVKVKGTCNHQDHAGLGVALPDALQRYRIRKLIEMGSNALRTSHNPPTPELLDACDELGMLVFDETRMMSSNPEGISQFANLVRRDRNHPSVFMWSMGNEEPSSSIERGVGILSRMKAVAKQHDGTRPVSIAPTGAIGTGGLDVCDVIGYNYMDQQAAAYHKKHPERPVIGTETVSAVGTRGIYITDPEKGFVSSYDPYTTTGRASAEGWWRFCDANEWLAGGFIWTGFDYRGEPSPNSWPNISSQYGILDTCGFPKDSFYYYKAWWQSEPVLHIFPHWNWPGYEGKKIAVWAYSNMDKVELLLNGQSLGAKDMKKNEHLAWDVIYSPGVLEARGYKDGKLLLTEKRETTGGATSVTLTADRTILRADGEDVAIVRVEVRDAEGRVVPVSNNIIDIKVSGSGKLIGTGNGDPTDHAPDKGASRKAFGGLCAAIVQTTKQAGAIKITASSRGLTSATLEIVSQGVELRPQVAVWTRGNRVGDGVTGLWRPENDSSNQLFIFEQTGAKLTGSVEGITWHVLGGDDSVATIEDGKVEGNQISFRLASATYAGAIEGDWITLVRSQRQEWRERPDPLEVGDKSLAIGPAPDGADPSGTPSRHPPADVTIVLRRARR